MFNKITYIAQNEHLNNFEYKDDIHYYCNSIYVNKLIKKHYSDAYSRILLGKYPETNAKLVLSLKPTGFFQSFIPNFSQAARRTLSATDVSCLPISKTTQYQIIMFWMREFF